MLPVEAKTYFDTLLASAFADEGLALSKNLQEFERAEFSKGRPPYGRGFAARIASVYNRSLSIRASVIIESLKTVHMSFNSPLDEVVDDQFSDWGARAISEAYQGLEGAYVRHLQRFGVQTVPASGLDQTYALARASIANLPRQYLWELRNVPAKKPTKPEADSPVHMTLNNFGTIGSVQTGAGSTANVQQQWVHGDTSELRLAICKLRETLERAEGIAPDLRRNVIKDINFVHEELEQEQPSKGKLLRWLGGIGAVVGTLGSVQPAYEVVRALARALGIPI